MSGLHHQIGGESVISVQIRSLELVFGWLELLNWRRDDKLNSGYWDLKGILPLILARNT